ncbi:hypothetical protein [Arthrobacter oryzae]|uniref:Uncharacterized protein n=1 Tax=Arthrobacter oryzae TaxID=409290 RepID=A0A3N0BSA0_9MICC|nr:hypothetical protein [Arthrobacter oryzae]RNL51971.1 hypothetical protein D7003_14625 [Arthrobacter oryzae]
MLTMLLRRSPALLRRAGLLAGFMMLIAGVFGMHLMSGTHSMAAAGAIHSADALSADQATVGHTGHDGPDADDGVTEPPSVPSPSSPAPSEPAASCAGSGGCAEMTGMDAACVPAPGTASLLAPLPGSTPFGDVTGAGESYDHTGYAFRPGTPSPGDLCISRT